MTASFIMCVVAKVLEVLADDLTWGEDLVRKNFLLETSQRLFRRGVENG